MFLLATRSQALLSQAPFPLEQALEPVLRTRGYMSWAAELRGGARAAAAGHSDVLAHSTSQGAAGSLCEPVPAALLVSHVVLLRAVQ